MFRDDESPAVTRCQAINVGWGDRDTANPHSTPPYTLFAISGGNTPLVVGNSTGSFYNWTVELPTGAPVLMSMKDSNGYTGGVSFLDLRGERAEAKILPSYFYDHHKF
jgi:hypothetical protein